MLRFRIFKLLGINYTNDWLKNHKKLALFENLTKKEVKDFFIWYLSISYCDNSKTIIFPYLKEAVISGIISANEVDEMLSNSLFAKSLPSDLLEYIYNINSFICPLWPKFNLIMVNKLAEKDGLLERVMRSTCNDYILKLVVDKLTELPIKEINVNLSSISYLDQQLLVKELVEKGNYTLLELKKFMIDNDLPISIIVPVFGFLLEKSREEEQNQVLDVFLELINEFVAKTKNENTAHKLIDIRSGHVTQEYELFVLEISKCSSYNETIRDKIAAKILALGNEEFMLYFVAHINSLKTIEMINHLVDVSIDMAIKVFALVPSELFNYTLNRIIAKEESYAKAIVDIMIENTDNFSIDTIGSVLKGVAQVYPKFKVGPKNAISLVKKGSKYSKILISYYHFSKEDRTEIINAYVSEGREDLMAVYGGYLISGHRARIVEGKDVDIDLNVLRRKNKNGND